MITEQNYSHIIKSTSKTPTTDTTLAEDHAAFKIKNTVWMPALTTLVFNSAIQVPAQLIRVKREYPN